MMKFHSILFLSIILVCNACNSEEPQSMPETKSNEQNSGKFNQIDPESSGITFLNHIEESEEVNHLTWDALFYGGGVALGDINNDGLCDVYFTGNHVSDALYLNKGGFKFEDISKSSGIYEEGFWSNGVSMADINADGFLDIYVCRSSWAEDSENIEARKNRLFINNGDNTFSEKAADYNVDNEAYSTQSAFFDYDGDNDLDMFLLNAPSNNLQQKVKYADTGFPKFSSDKLYENQGDHFEDVTAQAGLEAYSFGLGVVTVDLNHDGLTDIYVANDYEKPDYYYQNNGDGTFSNRLNQAFKHTSNTAMGVDAGDFDNDALQDLLVLDMQSESHYRSKTNMPTMSTETFFSYVSKGYNYQYMTNVLQKNNGTGFFSDVAQLANVASTDWSWSVLFADFDQDAYQDVFVSNGINRDIRNNDFSQLFDEKLKKKEAINLFELSKETPSTKISNYLFRNAGNLTFEKISEQANVDEPSFSYGAAYGDLDNDGDLDLVVNNNEMHPFIYENVMSTGNWLKITVKGEDKNTNGLNTKAVTFSKGKTQYRELTSSRGYQSSVEQKMHFGLGDIPEIDSLLVLFPDGKSIKLNKVKVNQELEVSYADALKQPYNVYSLPQRTFHGIPGTKGLTFNHKENSYDDWETEILLPHRESRNGPDIAVGDLNGDGLEDAMIAGAHGQSSEVFIQGSSGSFSKANGIWNQDAEKESTALTFFDLDNDGNMDIFSAHGGNSSPDNSPLYHDVVYKNNAGTFERIELDETINSACAAMADVNQDGFTDIFVGGGNVPNRYPISDGNTLYMNNNGELKSIDLKEDLLPKGMIKDAVFEDLNADGYPELIVLGHYMSPTIVWNNQGTFDRSEKMIDANGWWYTITPADINGDGKVDFICGNIGLNSKYHPSGDKPMKLFQGDFDGNNTNDIVLAKPFEGKYVPLRGRECSSEQLPYIQENFGDFESFATASIEDVLGSDNIEEAELYEVTEFASGILVNNGSGFDFVKFPNLAQIAPIMGCVTHDVNSDGLEDLIIAGNHFDAEVETTRHDSGNGLVLINDNNVNFTALSGLKSGFFAQGNVKNLTKIKVGSGYYILIGNNNSKLEAYYVK